MLPELECAQCMVTDEECFLFLWYQLNTLALNGLKSGVKALASHFHPLMTTPISRRSLRILMRSTLTDHQLLFKPEVQSIHV